MKKKIVIYLFFLMTMFLFFSNCRKYPEDHKLSFHGPLKRLITGTWALQEFLIDGDDSTNTFYSYKLGLGHTPDTIFWTLNEMTIKFRDKVKGYNGEYPYFRNCTIVKKYNFNDPTYYNRVADGKEWKLISNNKKLQLNIFDSYYPTPDEYRLQYLRSSNDWDIKKLTNKELIVESKNNEGKLIRIKFKNQ